MNAATFRLTLCTLLCAGAVPFALAQSSNPSSRPSSTNTSTSTSTAPGNTTRASAPNAATTTTAINPNAATSTAAPNAATTTTTTPTNAQTAPGTVATPPAPFAPPPVTQPVPGAVVPQVQPPGQVPAPVTPPAGPTAPGTVVQPPGSTNASTVLDANGQRIVVSGASIDALAAAGVEVAVDPQNTLANLRRADASGQQGVTAELQTRIDATGRALTEARAQARASGFPISDAQYDQLVAEIRLREDMLRETLRNAAISNSEAEWRQLQSVLDSQYSAYADAVLRANRMIQQSAQR